MKFIFITALFYSFNAGELKVDNKSSFLNQTSLDVSSNAIVNTIRKFLYKKNATLGMDLNHLVLCKCSIDYGCHGRTKGGLFDGDHDIFPDSFRKLYRDVCFTDGKCYQSVHSESEHYQHGYGCIDQRDFSSKINPDPMMPIAYCSNHGDEMWTCCDDGHFCANRTLIEPPFTAKNFLGLSKSWLVFISIVAFLLIVGLITWKYFSGWSILSKYRTTDTIGAIQMNNLEDGRSDEHGESNPMRNRGSTSSTNPLTQSSNLSTTEDTISSYDGVMGIHERLLRDLESTGSGSNGPVMLTERTIGMQISLSVRIGRGRFGTVFMGRWKGEDVAVKKFQSSDEMSWTREVAIFQTNMLRHPNVLRYIGSDRLDDGCSTELFLVTEYHPHGSLNDFLLQNAVDLHTAYSLMRSAANGLAFLHTEIPALKMSTKPAIAHRDIKSKNIMLKSDMTCAIGDLGLAVTYNSNTGNLDVPSNEKCGTVRYLAPEILSSTLQKNLFDAYRMADIYAFSLVMWEILVRTRTPKNKEQSPEDMLPYDGLVDRTPTLQQMCSVVHEQKLRPYVLPHWSRVTEFEHLSGIIEECWQPNPTARLSALQIRMRIERSQHQCQIPPPAAFQYRPPAPVLESKEAPIFGTEPEERKKLLRSKSFSGHNL